MKAFKKLAGVAAAGIVLGLSQSSSSGVIYNFSTLDSGATYNGGGSGFSSVIPDNSYSGLAYTINFADSGVNVLAINITLNISGGYSGDLYAYISHGDTLVQLLNPNQAISGSGMNNITLGNSGNAYPTSGTFTSGGTYVSYGDLTAFNNTSASGAWTIFFADLSPGDTSTLNSFNLSITAVPEPVTLALGTFAAMLLALTALKWAWRTK